MDFKIGGGGSDFNDWADFPQDKEQQRTSVGFHTI